MCRILVSFESRYGMMFFACGFCWLLRMVSRHRPKMSSEVLMLPASLSRSPRLWVLVVRSMPAKSQKDIVLNAASFGSVLYFVLINLTVKRQWDRLELWLSLVAAKCRFSFPRSSTWKASSAERTHTSFRPCLTEKRCKYEPNFVPILLSHLSHKTCPSYPL